MTRNTSLNAASRKAFMALLVCSLALPTAAQIAGPLLPNKAIYLGWGGYVTTDAVFTQFFHSNHTLSAWVLPQYPNGYEGTVFGNVQRPALDAFPGQTLNVGFGNLDHGPGGFPHLMVQLGNQAVRYYYPKIETGKWLHLALTRSGNRLHLYANGEYLTPSNFAACQTQGENLRAARNGLEEALKAGAPQFLLDSWKTTINATTTSLNECLNTNWLPEIQVDPAASGPLGVLQIGRTRAKANEPLAPSQFYGLVDDVAVYNRALTPNEIAEIASSNKRLRGNEANLIYALSFDKPEPGGIFQQAAVLNSPMTLSAKVWEDVAISGNRNNADAAQFDDSHLISATTVHETLPLPVGETWVVIQGFNQALGTHKGDAAFAYDIVKPPMSGLYPAGTIGAPVRTPESGTLVKYKRVDTSTGNDSEDTFVALRRSGGEVAYFRHLDGIPNFGGTCDATTLECTPIIGQAPVLAANSQVGVVGNRGKHLHTGARNQVEGVTIPVSYGSYWVSNDGTTWFPVWRGIPKTGQFVRRMN